MLIGSWRFSARVATSLGLLVFVVPLFRIYDFILAYILAKSHSTAEAYPPVKTNHKFRMQLFLHNGNSLFQVYLYKLSGLVVI